MCFIKDILEVGYFFACIKFSVRRMMTPLSIRPHNFLTGFRKSQRHRFQDQHSLVNYFASSTVEFMAIIEHKKEVIIELGGGIGSFSIFPLHNLRPHCAKIHRTSNYCVIARNLALGDRVLKDVIRIKPA
jgi:hypothetical protein